MAQDGVEVAAANDQLPLVEVADLRGEAGGRAHDVEVGDPRVLGGEGDRARQLLPLAGADGLVGVALDEAGEAAEGGIAVAAA